MPFLPLWIALSEERVKLLRRHSFAAVHRPQGVHQEQLNADGLGEEMKARCSSTLAPNFIQQRLVNPPHSRFSRSKRSSSANSASVTFVLALLLRSSACLLTDVRIDSSH